MNSLSDKNATSLPILKKTYSIGDKNITFEYGKLALLASGAVTINDETGNVVLVTAGIKESGINKEADFFPLVVDYQEKFYATGKIGGNRFQKREGRPSDTAVLTSRLIDRPIRPMFPKGFINDTQIIATVLSATSESDLGFYGITGASIALMQTGAPFEGPVSGVRVVMKDNGEFIFDPSFSEEKGAKLNLLVAGTTDAITMVESGGLEVSEADMIRGLEFSHNLIKKLCEAQKDFINDYKNIYGIPEIKEHYNLPDTELYAELKEFLTEEKLEILYNKGKKEFQTELDNLDIISREYIAGRHPELEENYLEKNIGELVYKRVKEIMRKNIIEKEKRLDGRSLDEVRDIKSETGLLPRTHGSALFQRGMTQSMTITTLGGPGDVQTIDDMYEESTKRYIHHYNFPPYSVGEVRMMRGVGRREIGHGRLAERAIEPVLPREEDFPYMIRVVSEITTCNGSSSMASVCGSTMSLMNAGVPITSPVAGVAMGMIYDEKTDKYKILTDIQAQEDFLGDMDFKVARTKNGITAMQLDVKVKGLKMEVFQKAFTQSAKATDHILEKMLLAQPEVSSDLSPYAPRIIQTKIPEDKIRTLIGKGGENVQRIEKDYEVDIHIEDDGTVNITSKSEEGIKKTMEEIMQMLWEPSIGDKLSGKIVNIIAGVGAIVEFNGKSGMIHISKLSNERVNNVEDVVKLGEMVNVEIIQIDKEKGRVGLKRIVG